MVTSKREKAKIMAHVLAGVVIILKGYAKWEDNHALVGGFFIILGLLLVSAVLWHHRVSRWIKNFDVFMFAIEALVLGLIAYNYYQEGKKGLPWAYGLSSLIYLILIVVFYRRNLTTKVDHRQSH